MANILIVEDEKNMQDIIAEYVNSETERMGKLIENLLDLSALERGFYDYH